MNGKKYLILLFFSLFWHILTQADIMSKNLGEKKMISSLRRALDNDSELNKYQFVIGAGVEGAKAFSSSSFAEKKQIRILLSWQWLEQMRSLSHGSVVVVPKHAFDENFASIADKIKLIQIDGVLTDINTVDLQKADITKIPVGTEIILMLAGDTQQQDGTWLAYTREMLLPFLESLPISKRILFLNGPRTGMHIAKDNKLILDEKAHRGGMDHISLLVVALSKGKNWHLNDFQFSQQGSWLAALRFCQQNPQVILILPGESTSMISESLVVGIKPVIYNHKIMTEISRRYVNYLVNAHKAYAFPEFPHQRAARQNPLPLQQGYIIQELKELIKSGAYPD